MISEVVRVDLIRDVGLKCAAAPQVFSPEFQTSVEVASNFTCVAPTMGMHYLMSVLRDEHPWGLISFLIPYKSEQHHKQS